MLISVDIGYGYTKAVSDTGKKVSFPSVIAPATVNLFNDMYSNGIGYRTKLSLPNGIKEVFVGESATQSLAARGFVARREKPAEIHDALLLTAAYLCGAGENADLVVGLPLAYYKVQKDTLKKRLQKLSAWVSVDDGKLRYISFKNVLVFPQGTGALFTIDKIPLKGIVGLIDIGTYTTEYLMFNLNKGVPVPILEACGSIEMGIHLALRSIATEYEKQTGAPLSQRMYQRVFDMVRNGEPVNFNGVKINLTPAWERIRKEIAEAISNNILAVWGDNADHLSLTAFAGGGAVHFWHTIASLFPNPIRSDEGYFANAVGFFKMSSGTKEPAEESNVV